MSSPDKQQLQQVLAAFLTLAETNCEVEQLKPLQAKLVKFVSLAVAVMPLDTLLDQAIIAQALESLQADNSVEETLMFSFMLSVYSKLKSGKRQPLEVGMIKQKIHGVLPAFEQGMSKGLINAEVFNSNKALLLSIADYTEDYNEAMAILAAGYAKYKIDDDESED